MSPTETLTTGRSETQLHYDPESGQVWLDTCAGEFDGLIVGYGPTRREAIRDAIDALNERLSDLWMALKPPHESARPCGCDPGAEHICDEHSSEAAV